jgi:hypothetical protein
LDIGKQSCHPSKKQHKQNYIAISSFASVLSKNSLIITCPVVGQDLSVQISVLKVSKPDRDRFALIPSTATEKFSGRKVWMLL